PPPLFPSGQRTRRFRRKHCPHRQYGVHLHTRGGLSAGMCARYYLTGMLMSTIWRYYLDTTVFALVSSVLLMFLISAAAIGYKVFSAATMNPVNTLRSE